LLFVVVVVFEVAVAVVVAVVVEGVFGETRPTRAREKHHTHNYCDAHHDLHGENKAATAGRSDDSDNDSRNNSTDGVSAEQKNDGGCNMWQHALRAQHFCVEPEGRAGAVRVVKKLVAHAAHLVGESTESAPREKQEKSERKTTE
jgi:hypothetical protein